MKVLFIYCRKFGYTPTIKTVEGVPDNKNVPVYFEDIQTAFIHVEEEDVVKNAEVEKKLVKNLKWICGKNQVKKVVIHSFAHLSDSKADPGFTMQFFSNIEERMKNAGYEVHQTPFGYFLDLQVDAPGFSFARVFKNIN
ncbi:MAG: threonyl-tRNA synthetase editing domain-containing protein [Bacteroidales bacterium]|nr:threonyl-tRNA synthetase editing domain-containing protein [Bacteroidales bacterium]